MLEPPRPSAEAPYTPCYLCDGVVRVGSMRFDVREPPRSSASTHIELRDGVVRVGSLCLNHPELVQKHPTHLASSVLVCFV